MRELAQATDNYSRIAPDVVQALSDLTRPAAPSPTSGQPGQPVPEPRLRCGGSRNVLAAQREQHHQAVSRQRADAESVGAVLTRVPMLAQGVDRVCAGDGPGAGQGNNEPGLHVTVNVQQSKGKYVRAATPPATATRADRPATRDRRAELRAGEHLHRRSAGRDVPSWGSVLVGPLYRARR